MNRSSPYYHLPYVVECKLFSHSAFFEPIAAFNDQGVALKYAADCRRDAGSRGSTYQVCQRFRSGTFAVVA